MTLVEALARYRTYHRDHRNVLTHAVGIPMIVLAVEILLSRPLMNAGAITLTPAVVAAALATLYYLRLDLRFGLSLGLLLALGAWAGVALARGSTGVWLAAGGGLFVVGWIFQFVGHHYEGRKPAFLDDLRSLLVGPLFVLAEAAFAAGLRHDLRQAVEAQAQAYAQA